jgi:hypothetical protein
LSAEVSGRHALLISIVPAGKDTKGEAGACIGFALKALKPFFAAGLRFTVRKYRFWAT